VRHRLVVGLTLGDPAGIGPEVAARAESQMSCQTSLKILGSAKRFRPGVPTLAGARQAKGALEESVQLLKQKKIHAVVNGPVSKEWLSRVGFRFPGQTEFYAHHFGKKPNDVTMCMVGPRLRVALVTTHLSLRQAATGVKASAIVRSGLHLAELLRKMGIRKPRIAVCGLNPHAGEGGLFGKEDKSIVTPAIRQLKKRSRLPFAGPEPADTVFLRALQGEFDGVVALYHDQGLIPAKLLDFDRTVNVTMGLPVVRCSPDHGTAFKLAGKGKANPDSMLEAVKLAVKLMRTRR